MTVTQPNPYANPAPKIATKVPSISDFIVDVEKAARRSLTDREMLYFLIYYSSTDVVVSADHSEEDKALTKHLTGYPENRREEAALYDWTIRNKVGAELVRVGVYPIENYLSPSQRG